jgi:hypothetical protein
MDQAAYSKNDSFIRGIADGVLCDLKPGKTKADPLRGLFEATAEGKSVILE